MFANFWTQIVSTDILSNFELRIIAVILKRLNFTTWMPIDYTSITEKLSLSKTDVEKVVEKLISYQIIESKGDSEKQDYYRYRLNSNFGWNKSVNWVFADGIDWQAFLASFQKLQSKFELKIQAIENKSEGTLVIHLEVSALANRTEVEKCLQHEYKLELQALEEKYRIKYNEGEIAIHQQNSANLLKIIKLIANTSNSLHDIVDIEPLQGEPVKLVLSHNNINDRQKKAKKHSRISPKQKQTLVEAVAEKEKLSKSLDLTEVDKKAHLDNYVDTQDKGSFLKQKIRARLNKHSH